MATQFSKSFKVQAVKKALIREEGISVKDIACELSLGYSTLQRWILQTKNHELELSNDLSNNGKIMRREKRPTDWTAEQKLAIIIKCGALDDNGVNQLCREQGIYPHHIKQWTNDIIKNEPPKIKVPPATSKMKRQIKALQKELNRKEKALAETAALLVLQKKVNLIWNQDEED
jgi:transposase-like protein